MRSPADELLIAREPAMPGLATLLDDELFVALLRTLCPTVEIRGGQATYVRYKPQTSCLVAYRLRVGGEETLVYALAHTGDAQEKLAKAEQGGEIGSALGPGCLTVATLGLVIYGFPTDRELLALRKLADPTTRREFFQRLLPASPQFWTSDLIHLRYKPERRYVARLQADGRQVLVKFYNDHDYPNAALAARAFRSKQALHVVQLLGHSDKYQTQAWAWLAGQPLDAALQSTPGTARMLHQVACALATLHGKKRKRLMPYPPAAEIAAVQTAAAAVAAICPQWTQRAQDLAWRLTRQFEGTTFSPCAIHSDFSADQVLLLDDERVVLLDLDNAGMGDPMSDLGAFVAKLKQDALHGLLPMARADDLVGEFVQAYGSLAPHTWDATRFHTQTAARLLRLASEPFRQRKANWVDAVEGTLHLAEEISDYAHA